jgi:hypothetical protein
VQRDFERDDPRRRYRSDDDRRGDPRERYGNEEDPWSREYRRAYAEADLPRRLHDDRPYDRPGYEPESGRPGGRQNVDMDRGRQPRQRGRYANEGDRFGDEYDRGFGGPRDRSRGYGQPPYGRSASPYDQGEIAPWYGADTGMGDSGSSQYVDRGASSSEQGDRTGLTGGQMRGRFSGRGPRGYRRSDERIREDVCELLTRHGEIDASEMDVEVHDGTIILRGTADSGRTRRLTEELVEDVAGVHDVQNELRVNRRTAYGAVSPEAMVDTGVFAEDRDGVRESGPRQ